MGDFQSDLNSIKWINLFLNSITGNTNLEENTPCFRKFGYDFLYSTPFEIIYKDKKKIIHPDFLLWNKKDKIALIIEVKGENSISEEHIKQLEKYTRISAQMIMDLISNEVNDHVEIKNVLVGIVYRNETYINALSSASATILIEKICSNYLFFTQSHGDELLVINSELIPKSTKLKDLFDHRITLEENPKPEIYLVEHPCVKSVIWAILIHIQKEFYNNNHISTIEKTPSDFSDVFKYSNVKLNNIRVALDKIYEKNYCSNEGVNYIFSDGNCMNIIQNMNMLKQEILDFEGCKHRKTVVQRRLDE